MCVSGYRKSGPVENKSFPQQTLSVSADKCEHGLHVKRASILNQLRFFHVVDGLCLDVMHDQLEGVLPLEIKLLLKKYIKVEEYITLGTLIERIRTFDYGPSDISKKPSPIN